MTAKVLGTEAAPKHAVIGTLSGDRVRHVGLLSQTVTITRGPVSVHHMRPPIELPGTIDAHAVGWLDDLTEDERMGLEDWLAGIKTRLESGSLNSHAYWANPSVLRDQTTGRAIALRFSCAGLVSEAYRDGAGVQLLVDDNQLPEADKTLLMSVWGSAAVQAGSRYGLTGSGPWRVMLPGYLLHALRLGRAHLPYNPILADASFASEE